MDQQSYARADVISPPANGAWRAYLCLESICRHHANDPMVKVLADAFKLADAPAGPDLNDLVRLCLLQLRRQVDQTIRTLERQNVMPQLYAPLRTVAKVLGDIDMLSAPLGNYQNLKNEANVLAMGWAAHVLPPDLASNDWEALAALLTEITALHAKLSNVGLPPHLLKFMEQLLQGFQEELVKAQFTGGAGLKYVIQKVNDQVENVSEEMRTEIEQLDQPQKAYLKQALDTIKTVGEVASSGNAVLELCKGLVSVVIPS